MAGLRAEEPGTFGSILPSWLTLQPKCPRLDKMYGFLYNIIDKHILYLFV